MLFIKDDSTEQVAAVRLEIAEEMAAAKEYLGREEEPGGGCDCHLKGRSRPCCAFAYSHPHIPDYSVHDIVRIGSSKKKLAYFMDEHIYSLDAIPDHVEMGDAQLNQVYAHKRGKPMIEADTIRTALEAYAYPVNFFDYETYAPAIPVFNGYSPYQRIPFQFSLHILRAPDGELEHVDFLQEELRDPTEDVARLLGEHIDPKGSVVVWFAPFERGVNAEIARRTLLPAAVMSRINAQLVDLREIFAGQHFVHPAFSREYIDQSSVAGLGAGVVLQDACHSRRWRSDGSLVADGDAGDESCRTSVDRCGTA